MGQIRAGQIGVVVAQGGAALPIGAKSALYKPELSTSGTSASSSRTAARRVSSAPVLPPGTVAPIHPVGFLVITKSRVYGVPVADEYARAARSSGSLGPQSFGLSPEQLDVVRIEPKKFEGKDGSGRIVDMIGIVTTLEGLPLPKGAIANRLGDFTDITELESRRSEEHTSELQSPDHLVCRLLLEKKKQKIRKNTILN